MATLVHGRGRDGMAWEGWPQGVGGQGEGGGLPMIVIMRVGCFIYPGTPVMQDGREIGRCSQRCEPDPDHPGYFLVEVALYPAAIRQGSRGVVCDQISVSTRLQWLD